MIYLHDNFKKLNMANAGFAPKSQEGMENLKASGGAAKVEKESGLAPAAQAILEGVFQTPEYSKFLETNVALANKVLNGRGTPEDRQALLDKIDDQLSHSYENYSQGGAYAETYFRRLKEQVEKM